MINRRINNVWSTNKIQNKKYNNSEIKYDFCEIFLVHKNAEGKWKKLIRASKDPY